MVPVATGAPALSTWAALGGRASGFVTGAGAASIAGESRHLRERRTVTGAGETDVTGFYLARSAHEDLLPPHCGELLGGQALRQYPCPVDPAAGGTAVGLTVGATTPSINFELRPDLVFKDGFE